MMSLRRPGRGERSRCSGVEGASRRGVWGLSLLAGLVVGAGCGSKSLTPVTGILEALGDPTESVADLSEALVRILDAPSRQAIADRAARLTAEAGVPVGVEHILQARGLAEHRRVARVETEVRDDGTASLLVHLAPLTPAPTEGQAVQSGSAPATVELTARLEDGEWRLSLQDLAPLIGRVPLVADGGAR